MRACSAPLDRVHEHLVPRILDVCSSWRLGAARVWRLCVGSCPSADFGVRHAEPVGFGKVLVVVFYSLLFARAHQVLCFGYHPGRLWWHRGYLQFFRRYFIFPVGIQFCRGIPSEMLDLWNLRKYHTRCVEPPVGEVPSTIKVVF